MVNADFYIPTLIININGQVCIQHHMIGTYVPHRMATDESKRPRGLNGNRGGEPVQTTEQAVGKELS